MATPFLRALRGIYPAAHIAAIARPLVRPVLTGLPTISEIANVDAKDAKRVVAYLRATPFDLGIVLPNSFRSAAALFRGRVKRRLGYARDWRSLLLTDRVRPIPRSSEQQAQDQRKAAAIREIRGGKAHPPIGSRYQPTPTIDYYLALAKYLGAASPDRQMELAITDAECTEAEAAHSAFRIPHSPFITLVPGANFGSSKCWPPERFAEVADHLVETYVGGGGLMVVIASSPAELPIVDAILAASRHPDRMVALARCNGGKGLSLGALKELVRRSRLMICNDTGPRHFAAALGVPVVTLFGPTDPLWAETFVERERQVRIEVPCGPCQLKRCPIDHRCMKGLSSERVLAAVAELTGRGGGA